MGKLFNLLFSKCLNKICRGPPDRIFIQEQEFYKKSDKKSIIQENYDPDA